jgi:hypothetical protein
VWWFLCSRSWERDRREPSGAGRPVNPAAVVTRACNCPTKQYLGDRSVPFSDIRATEAIMALRPSRRLKSLDGSVGF